MDRAARIRKLAQAGLDRAAIAARLCLRLQVVDTALAAPPAASSAPPAGEAATEMRDDIPPGQATDRWSAAEIEILRRGYAEGLGRAGILARLPGRTLSGISYKAQELGLRNAAPPWSADELAELRRLYVPGADAREVAGRIGRPLKAVHTKAHELGLHLRRPWTGDEVRRLIDAQARGRMLTEVAAELGRPYANVAAKARWLALDFRRPGRGKVAPRPAPAPAPAAVAPLALLILAAAATAARLEAAIAGASRAIERSGGGAAASRAIERSGGGAAASRAIGAAGPTASTPPRRTAASAAAPPPRRPATETVPTPATAEPALRRPHVRRLPPASAKAAERALIEAASAGIAVTRLPSAVPPKAGLHDMHKASPPPEAPRWPNEAQRRRVAELIGEGLQFKEVARRLHAPSWVAVRDTAAEMGLCAKTAAGSWVVPGDPAAVAMPPRRPKRRPCLRCGRPMLSDGPHHRLCTGCRAAAADIYDPEPAHG